MHVMTELSRWIPERKAWLVGAAHADGRTAAVLIPGKEHPDGLDEVVREGVTVRAMATLAGAH